MGVKITVEGATEKEIARGVAAAQDVFDKAGVTPERAADARFNVEGWDIRGFQDPIDDDDLELCGVWDDADTAALKACCAGWDENRRPTSANLELTREQPAGPYLVRYAKRQDKAGSWEVYEIETGQAVVLDGLPFNGVDEREADEVIELLHAGEIEPDE